MASNTGDGIVSALRLFLVREESLVNTFRNTLQEVTTRDGTLTQRIPVVERAIAQLIRALKQAYTDDYRDLVQDIVELSLPKAELTLFRDQFDEGNRHLESLKLFSRPSRSR
jgi:hypothetical protein